MFRLKAPIAPPVRRLPPPHRDALTGALSDAMKCLLSGDHEQLDRLELEYLNVLVRIGEFGVRYPDGEPYEFFAGNWRRFQEARRPFVVKRLRGAGPGARSALVWSLLTPCQRCEGLLRHKPCHVCGGRWYVDDNVEWLVYTDLDGMLVSESID